MSSQSAELTPSLARGAEAAPGSIAAFRPGTAPARAAPTAARARDEAARHATRQTILSVVLEVEPKRAEILRRKLDALREEESGTHPPFNELCREVPVLHFLSVTIFPDDHHDPVLVIEANFDGPPAPFWEMLETHIGPHLRDMLRCCKPPRDADAALFQAITRDGATAPLAPYLAKRATLPAISHQGNRGLSRARIEQETVLFDAVQERLRREPRATFAGMTAQQIHAWLRAEMRREFPWLDSAGPPRIADAEHYGDWARLLGFAGLVLLGLGLPAILAWALLPWWSVPVLSLLACLPSLVLLRRELREAGPTVQVPRSPAILGAAAVLLVLGILPVLLALLARIRRLERCDPPQDAPPVDEAEVARMSAREDRLTQNHMGSVVLVKPGVLRAIVIRAGLRGLGLLLRVRPRARAGYLASMRTIHFAHWALISNGGRLMFFSNFDGTWESYLDDFIEKAHNGLTLAWSSGVGFPPTRFLWFEGATHGRRFKAWARSSMAASNLWFSAYPTLTVEQIERQHAIAEGLRKAGMEAEEAEAWTARL
ncbi:hypothetical protein [Roseicella aerolata]|uniref:Uncharacterized protein n=1 Tax=Roseicella aerolata TaxID=2883479 RepID=A0A9X1L9S9_9PROT|nr:hypothetical protein [Roseicella aerolata]MCB4821423.1 hypothetical protein [Roseicella aerolata]